jgi:hypothetical protein
MLQDVKTNFDPLILSAQQGPRSIAHWHVASLGCRLVVWSSFFQDIALLLPLLPSGLDAVFVIVDRQSKIVPFFSLNR